MNITHQQETIEEIKEHITELENTNSSNPSIIDTCIKYWNNKIEIKEQEIKQLKNK
tara:strand:- start:13 stop:180 length:168 start_codon:yes stop_codon:yes gene_type:complete